MNAFEKFENELLGIVENTYRKLKSHIYYSNSLSYLKKKIGKFEINMKSVFQQITVLLLNPDSDESKKYLKKLLKNITYKVLPKITTTKESHLEQIVDNKDLDVEVNKVNLFFDAPIDIYILDTLWTLIVGKLFKDYNVIAKEVKSNIFDYNLFNQSSDILSSINFESLALYVPYFKKYKEWKNDALYVLDNLYEEKKDSIMFSLDISNYFYSVDFKFKELYEAISNEEDARIYDFTVLNNVIEKVYSKFSKKISEIRTDVLQNKIVLPISLPSAALMGNFYLSKFDKAIVNNKSDNIKYYARYVDDIIFVFEDNLNVVDCSIAGYIKQYLGDKFKLQNNNFSFQDYEGLIIQNKKIKVIKYDHNESKGSLSAMINEITKISEPNLLPNLGVDIQNFINSIYSNTINSTKIREISSSSIDKLKLICATTNYLKINKSTARSLIQENEHTTTEKRVRKNIKTQYEKIDFKTFQKMKLLFKSSAIFELYNNWDKFFYFILLTIQDDNIASICYETLIEKIKKIKIKTIEKIAEKHLLDISKKVIESLEDVAKIAYGLAVAVRITAKCENEIKKLAYKLRKANIFDYKMVTVPLINYYDNLSIDYNLSNTEEYLKKFSNTSIENHKIKYSPRFIHLHEFLLHKNTFFINKLQQKNFFEENIKEYNQLLKVTGHYKEEFLLSLNNGETKTKMGYVYRQKRLKVFSNKYKKNMCLDEVYVAMANINVTNTKILLEEKKENDLQKSKKNLKINFNPMTASYKFEIWSMLLVAKKQKKVLNPKNVKIRGIKRFIQPYINKLNFIVFPELSMPFEWLNDLAEFSKNSGIAIIAGVRYFKVENRVYNLIATILPYSDSKGYRSAVVDLREKNDYSPKEKRIIENNGYAYNEDNTLYNIYSYNGLNFSIFNCYELTDIYARAIMKSKLDMLFVPEYNADISYFSNIIESSSRDIYCYITQVNSSDFGDTRIIGPLSEKYNNIALIKGGEWASLHVGKINIKEFRDYQSFEQKKEYEDYLDKQIYKEEEKNCYRKYKKTSAKHKPNKSN